MTPASCPTSPPHAPSAQRGLSLIELMVSMAIGLVVVGAVLTNYLNNTSASRKTSAMAQVSSDGAVAMGILRNHLAMAGFAQPTSVDASGVMQFSAIGQGIVGCGSHAMTRTDSPTPGAPAIWGCGTAVTTSDSILIRYQTDSDVSPLTKTDSLPMDCIGDGIAINPTSHIYIAENNFYVSQDSNGLPALYCRGSSAGQPLVENVTEMHLTFGVADVDSSSGKLKQIKRYAQGTVGNLPDTTGAWNGVKAVRICLVVRSADAVLTVAEPYVGCDKSIARPAATDHHIYRTFTTTVVLNNRLATL